jgi:hypothetical protein
VLQRNVAERAGGPRDVFGERCHIPSGDSDPNTAKAIFRYEEESMSQESRNLVQDLFNKATAQSELWVSCRALTVAGYMMAYSNHQKALKTVDKNLELDKKALYLLFVGIAASMIGPWIGRLLEPGEEAAKQVAGDIFNKTIDSMNDKTVDLMKDSIAEGLAKNTDSDRPWEPVGLEPQMYDKMTEASLGLVSGKVLGAIGDLVARADTWSLATAQYFVSEFKRTCPYFTDLPPLQGLQFQMALKSEKGMWIQWALLRDEKWWQQYNGEPEGIRVRVGMDPILDTMEGNLNVPESEIESVVRVGNTFGSGPRSTLDMLKLIAWAKRNKPLTSTELEAAKQAGFFLRSRLQSSNNYTTSSLIVP